MKGCFSSSSNSFVTCHKEIGYFFQYCLSHWVTATKISFFMALSQWNKQISCLFLWVTVTNKICICCQKGPKHWAFWYFVHFLPLFVPLRHFLFIFCIYIFLYFCHFLATNNNFVFCSDSVRQTKNPAYGWHQIPRPMQIEAPILQQPKNQSRTTSRF